MTWREGERERELYLHFSFSGNKDGMNGNEEGRVEERAHHVFEEEEGQRLEQKSNSLK